MADQEQETDTSRPPDGPIAYAVWEDADGVTAWEVRHHHHATTGSYLCVAHGNAMNFSIASGAAQMAYQVYREMSPRGAGSAPRKDESA